MNSWQTFPILSVPNDAPIVEVRNPNHFVQPFVFVAFFVIFCGDQSWFYGMLWISDGYRCSFTQDFHHFLSFPPLFPNVSMISKALRLRGCQEVASQPRYTKSIHIYIPRSTKSWENAGWTGEPGAWRVIPRIVGKQASKPGFGGKTLIYHILEYPHIATQSHSHSGLIFLIFDAKEVQWIQRPESQP